MRSRFKRIIRGDSANPFSKMIQRFIRAEFPQLREPAIASSSSSSSSSSFLPVTPPPNPFVDPPLAIPLLKTRAGARGDSRWSFSMDLHYLQTGFSRCEIKIGASHPAPRRSHLRLRQKRAEKTEERELEDELSKDERLAPHCTTYISVSLRIVSTLM